MNEYLLTHMYNNATKERRVVIIEITSELREAVRNVISFLKTDINISSAVKMVIYTVLLREPTQQEMDTIYIASAKDLLPQLVGDSPHWLDCAQIEIHKSTTKFLMVKGYMDDYVQWYSPLIETKYLFIDMEANDGKRD